MQLELLAASSLLNHCSWAVPQERALVLLFSETICHAPKLIAIITAPGGTGVGAKILEVWRGLAGFIIVIPRRRPGALAVPAPGPIIASRELLFGTTAVSMISHDKHRPGNLIQNLAVASARSGLQLAISPAPTRTGEDGSAPAEGG